MTALDQDEARLDMWLWRARFFKSRARAARFVAAKGVRVTRFARTERVAKPHYCVRTGDILTFAPRTNVISISVRALGVRRGPASEARALYADAASAGEET